MPPPWAKTGAREHWPRRPVVGHRSVGQLNFAVVDDAFVARSRWGAGPLAERRRAAVHPSPVTDAAPPAAKVRDRTAALHAFCFAYPELFLIPAEALSPSGIDDAFARAILAHRPDIDPGWVAAFDAAFSAYYTRATELYAKAPDAWFPPRLVNLCIVTEPAIARPYHQPFVGASWSLDRNDFDPEVAPLEFSTYQLLHAERLAAAGDMARAIVGGLSYWLVRSDAEIEAFCQGCAASRRPDAAAFRHLAEAMPWVRTLMHPRLRPPPKLKPKNLHVVREGSLLVPEAAREPLQALVPRLREAAVEAVSEHRRTSTARPAATTVDEICQWLASHAPRVLVTLEDEAPVWDPQHPHECDALKSALANVSPVVLHSLRQDFAVVDARTRAFLDSLRRPEALPKTSSEVDRTGGVYLHDERQLVVYSLVQSGLDPRREPAPAYHRMLLGARTIHEWGHLADEAGWLGVPPQAQADYRKARQEIGTAVDAIVSHAPEPFQKNVAEDARKAGRGAGALVCSLVLFRMPDYVSNMLARRYLPPSELEAYVRANVAPHFDEALTPTELLARHAFEYQYLGLGLVDDPLRYFLQATWFSTYLIDTGVVTEARLAALFEAVAALCACYRVDPSAFVA